MPKSAIEFGQLAHATGIWSFACDSEGLKRVRYGKPVRGEQDQPISTSPLVASHRAALSDMLDGHAAHYSLPIAIEGGTDFQRHVWRVIATIGHGQTLGYQAIAKQINSKAVRAVGSACGANPVPIAIPCHRVLRSDGSIGGYAFGADVKIRLLKHEGCGFKT